MSRLRFNNEVGTLGASLTNSGTTITFASAPSFPTLSSPDYIPLILEPTGSSPSANFEIVWLTAYTSGGTTGTISRGQEGTTAVAHSNGVAWAQGPTAQDGGGFPEVATTGAAGYALVNSTGTIISWTAPNDGKLHTISLQGSLIVSAAETGGQIQAHYSLGGNAYTSNAVGSAKAAGIYGLNGNGGSGIPAAPFTTAIDPGSTFSLMQASALTAGAAAVYATILGE